MKQWKSLSVAVLISFSVLFVFQNCADPVEFGAEDTLSVAPDTIPFAFEEKMDTISYMSCSNLEVSSFQPRAIYTFRVGAYKDNAGIRLSQAFFDKTNSYQDSGRAQLLYDSKKNSGASLQLAIREASTMQKVLINEAGKVNEGFDYSNFLAPLDTSGIATRLAITTDGEWANYFAGTPGLGTRFVEQSIRFIESENRSSQVRSKLMGSAGVERENWLAVTYTTGNAEAPYLARAPVENAQDKVYGTGFQVEFRNPSGFANGPQRALKYITEYDLSTGMQKLDAQWDCGPGDGYTFTIVRANEATSGATTATTRTCMTVADGEVSTGAALTEFELQKQAIARRVLRAEDWWVDPRNMCVVAKHPNATCYGDANGAPVVNYTGACSATAKNCPHIVSICERAD